MIEVKRRRRRKKRKEKQGLKADTPDGEQVSV